MERPRYTIRSLMAAIGIAALIFALLRLPARSIIAALAAMGFGVLILAAPWSVRGPWRAMAFGLAVLACWGFAMAGVEGLGVLDALPGLASAVAAAVLVLIGQYAERGRRERT